MRPPIFRDRADAGRKLAAALSDDLRRDAVVVGLARGGISVAAEVARILGAPLDVVAVRKIGHLWQSEYAIGAVAPGNGVYLRGNDGMSEEEVAEAVDRTRREAEELDARLHARHPPLPLAGRTAILVDDGLATGATMIAAVRWARACGAGRVVAAVPVAASQSAVGLRTEADVVV